MPLVKEDDTSTYKRAHSIESYKYKRPDAVICAGSLIALLQQVYQIFRFKSVIALLESIEFALRIIWLIQLHLCFSIWRFNLAIDKRFHLESIEIECMMHRAQFFLARACEANIKLAMETSLWTTHPLIEKLLAEAYRRAPVVILIFLARNADHFAGDTFYFRQNLWFHANIEKTWSVADVFLIQLVIGFARMCSEALYKGQPAMRWVDFKGGGNIKLQWITKCPLALSASDHIKNPFNKGTS